MKTVIATDEQGREFPAYEAYAKDGTCLHIDKNLADLSGNPDEFVRIEVKAADKCIDYVAVHGNQSASDSLGDYDFTR